MFEVTERTTVKGGEFGLPESSQSSLANDIANYLNNNNNNTAFYIGGYNISRAFAPFEMVTREGKLAKRISKWVKEQHGVELNSEQLSELGSIISAYNPGEITYDVTDEFDWQAGDFGDGGSCFWGGRSDAKQLIREYGGLALRIYRNNGKGGGRCWVMPKGEDWIMFNAYGPDLQAFESYVKAIFPDSHTTWIKLENMGETSGLIYINNCRGVMVSKREGAVKENSHVDLRIEEGGSCQCHECGDWIREDDAQWIEDYTYCQSCYDDRTEECMFCKAYGMRDEMTYIDQNRYRRGGTWLLREGYVCESCYYDRHSECNECGCNVDTMHHEMVEIGYKSVCPYCIKHEYHKCDECGEYRKNGDECTCQDASEEEVVVEVPRMVAYADLNRLIPESEWQYYNLSYIDNELGYQWVRQEPAPVVVAEPEPLTIGQEAAVENVNHPRFTPAVAVQMMGETYFIDQAWLERYLAAGYQVAA